MFYFQKRQILGKQFEALKSVRITPVDNFQGEENKIILLSLVRSNNEGRAGFLSSEHRVCVALSRARDGFYIVGNMNCLEANNTIWPKVKQQLQTMNAIGNLNWTSLAVVTVTTL